MSNTASTAGKAPTALLIELVEGRNVSFKNVTFPDEASVTQFERLFRRLNRKPRQRRTAEEMRTTPPLPLGAPARAISVEINDFLEDMRRRNLTRNSVAAYRQSLAALKHLYGDMLASTIDRDQIRQLWDLMLWAPKNCFTDPRYAGKEAEDLMQLGRLERVRPTADGTMSKHHAILCRFFNSLKDAHAISMSPMDGFTKPKRDLTSERRKRPRWLTDDELQRIFNPETFIAWAKHHPHRWWAPMIGLYTGARVGEVAQMKVSDVVCINGRWFFAIRKTADSDLAHTAGALSRQTLKGKSAERNIPIAQPLIDAGFLVYLQDLKDATCTRLFPHLTAGHNKKTGETNALYSQGLVQQFRKYMAALGFDGDCRFHAFRRTLVSMLSAKGVPDRDISLITGHAMRDQSQVISHHYRGEVPEETVRRQVITLSKYQPIVALPVYTKGQFDTQLKNKSKHYP
ncbi:site-specific integrase [Lysobacter yananisis]|uniref:Site-specific integrase n=1 Tax=Lysobacter yananisis TaxID=1003114 RepID=A0ABY9P795_9GAMM|nr:site-specific integrase [Lysobacter yananisis]WMT02945.1 site-specific integrase [Lysobacter yananisis]